VRACALSIRTTAGLSASQRLLLALVLFGPATYQQAADHTGLTAAEVSRRCTSALRQLFLACRVTGEESSTPRTHCA